MKNQPILQIRLHCHNLPVNQFDDKSAVRLGIQKGQSVIEDVSGDAPEAIFTAELRVAIDPETQSVNFLGPYAHGTPNQRFLYLNWGQRQGENWEGFRRLKIHLSHLDAALVQHAIESAQPLTVSLNMTGKKGDPLCGSARGENIVWEILKK